jgi:hypothetical protein
MKKKVEYEYKAFINAEQLTDWLNRYEIDSEKQLIYLNPNTESGNIEVIYKK